MKIGRSALHRCCVSLSLKLPKNNGRLDLDDMRKAVNKLSFNRPTGSTPLTLVR